MEVEKSEASSSSKQQRPFQKKKHPNAASTNTSGGSTSGAAAGPNIDGQPNKNQQQSRGSKGSFRGGSQQQQVPRQQQGQQQSSSSAQSQRPMNPPKQQQSHQQQQQRPPQGSQQQQRQKQQQQQQQHKKRPADDNKSSGSTPNQPQQQPQKPEIRTSKYEQQQQQQQNADKPSSSSNKPEDGGEGGSSKQPRKRNRNLKRLKQSGSDADQSGSANREENVNDNADDMEEEQVEATKAESKPSSSSQHLSQTSFESLVGISPLLKKALKEHLKYDKMTIVQEATLPAISSGKDVLAKAKTGTGKTIAFLLHTLNRLSSVPRESSKAISALIISPTRELACQIEQEAKDLLIFHPANRVNVECIYGGYNVSKDLNRFNSSQPIDMLIATPGRFEDVLTKVEDLRARLQSISVLILDEADQLLEMGFRPAIERIIRSLPPKTSRQTLLFSATIPKQMEQVLSIALKDNHQMIDCVGEDQVQTHAQVKQEYILCPLERMLATLESVLQTHVAANPKTFKVICFLPTARQAQYYSEMFMAAKSSIPSATILAIHSRKSQAQRTKTSDQFKQGTKMIMFSSDVTARGMDYPDVTLVIQLGLVEREQYIHRVGRTARAGASGEAVLIIDPFEEFMLRSLQDVPLESRPIPQHELSPAMKSALAQVANENSELNKTAQQAYQAWLGFYNGYQKKLRWSPAQLVEKANFYSQVMGLKQVPFLLRKTVGMMGLRGVPGLRVQ